MNIKEFRVLIKHCFLMGKNTVEAKQWLDKHYGDSVPGKSTIDWYAEFKHGRVLVDSKLKLHEIADTLKISEGSVFTILQGYGIRILGHVWYFVYQLSWERQNH